MLRTALLFLCMLGFLATGASAAPVAAAKSRPIHRHKPMAGNYVPVYRTYRYHSNQKRGFFGLHKKRSKAAKRAAKRYNPVPRATQSSRARRTL